MLLHLLAFVLLMVFLLPVFADGESTQKISSSSQDSGYSSIVTDGKNIFIVWMDSSRSGHSEIFFSKSTDGGKTFVTPKSISDKQRTSIAPFVTTDGANVFVTWTDDQPKSRSILLTKSADGGLTFTTPQKISNNVPDSAGSKISVNGKNIFLAWTSTTWSENFFKNMEIYFTKNADDGLTFTTPQNISNDEEFSQGPSIAISGNNIYVTWSNDHMDNSVIYFTKSTDNGQTFSVPHEISNNMTNSVGPDIATNGTVIYVTWVYAVKGENHDVLFSKSTDNGQTFSTPKNISNTNGYSTTPTIAISGTDIFITWTDDAPKSRLILFSKSTDGGLTFSTPQTISNNVGFSSDQSTATDGKNIFNTWTWAQRSVDDHQELYFSKSAIMPSLTGNNTDTASKNNTSVASPQVNDAQSVSNIDNTPSAKDIKWLNENGANYGIGGIGIIRLDNSELNVNKQLIDIPVAHVWSNTDTRGIPVQMIETGEDTGVFYANINLSSEKSATLQIQVSNGDTITASFEDASQDEPLVDTVKIVYKYVSPLKQLAQNTPIDKITCKDNYKIVIKDKVKPFCLTERTYAKLLARGFFNTQ